MFDSHLEEFIFVSLCAYFTAIPMIDARAKSSNTRLYNALGLNDGDIYNPMIPPSNTTHPVQVHLWFRLEHIYGVQDESALHTNVELIQKWHDLDLMWNPDDYNNITHLVVNAKSVWTPDIIVQNSVLDTSLRFNYFFGEESELVKLEYTGIVTRNPSYLLRTVCQFDFKYFPYDAHKCPFLIRSVQHDVSALRLYTEPFPKLKTAFVPTHQINDTHVFTKDAAITPFDETNEWQLEFMTSKEVFSEDADGVYFDLTLVEIVISRDSSVYHGNIVNPFIYLLWITLFTALLPPKCLERISILMAVLLAYTVMCLIVTDSIPKYSSEPPLLNEYLTYAMYYNVCLLGWCCFFLGMYSSKRCPLLCTHVKKCICGPDKEKEQISDQTREEEYKRGQNLDEDQQQEPTPGEEKKPNKTCFSCCNLKSLILYFVNFWLTGAFLIYNVILLWNVWADLPKLKQQQITELTENINVSELVDFTEMYG